MANRLPKSKSSGRHFVSLILIFILNIYMKEKNCLIFGGSGQIGRHLMKVTKNNYRVTVVTRNIHQKSCNKNTS